MKIINIDTKIKIKPEIDKKETSKKLQQLQPPKIKKITYQKSPEINLI